MGPITVYRKVPKTTEDFGVLQPSFKDLMSVDRVGKTDPFLSVDDVLRNCIEVFVDEAD